MKKIFLTTVALAVMAIFISLAPSTVYAQATITACQNTSDGTLRIVSASTTCKKNETKISWPSVDTNTLGALSCTAGQIAKFLSGTWQCAADKDTDTDTLGALTCTAGQTVKFNGTAWVCDPPRFVDNGDGTISDNQTGLMWEKKTACTGASATDIHCVNNTYQWSSSGTAADGALFTDFLARLNTKLSTSSDGGSTVADVCFAGHCDWRIPNIAELRTILLASCSSGPCIDAIFGPTAASFYWSSTTPAKFSDFAFFVYFVDGFVGFDDKTDFFDFARAVRGGR